MDPCDYSKCDDDDDADGGADEINFNWVEWIGMEWNIICLWTHPIHWVINMRYDLITLITNERSTNRHDVDVTTIDMNENYLCIWFPYHENIIRKKKIQDAISLLTER